MLSMDLKLWLAEAVATAAGSSHMSVSVAFVSVSVTSLLGLELSAATDGDSFVSADEIRPTAAVTVPAVVSVPVSVTNALCARAVCCHRRWSSCR